MLLMIKSNTILKSISTTLNFTRSTWKLSRRLELPKEYQKKTSISPYIVGSYIKDVNPQPEYQEVYDLLDHENAIRTDKQYKPDVKVILLQNVDGMGGIGDVIKVRWRIARTKLIIPKKAVYASEFNLKWYRDVIENKSDNLLRPSSLESPFTKRGLQSTVFTLLMSDVNSWTIEPFHIRCALRRGNVFVASDEPIVLPETPVSGPDMQKQLKVLVATIVINNHERVASRFVITHKNVPLKEQYWAGWLEPVLEEQREILQTLPITERTVRDDEFLDDE